MQEKETEKFSRQFNTIMRDMQTIKNTIENIKTFPALPAQQAPNRERYFSDIEDGKNEVWMMLAGR